MVINAVDQKSSIVGLLGILGFAITTAILLAKKGLMSDLNGFYQGLMVDSIVFHKEKINIEEFEKVLVFENLKKQNIPAWTGLTIDMFINDNAFILYLIQEQEHKKEYLMSFHEKDSMEKAVRFLRNRTTLKIEYI